MIISTTIRQLPTFLWVSEKMNSFFVQLFEIKIVWAFQVIYSLCDLGKEEKEVRKYLLILLLFPFIQHSEDLMRFQKEAWTLAQDPSGALTLFISCSPRKDDTVMCSVYNFICILWIYASVKHLCRRPHSPPLSTPAAMSVCGRAPVSSELAPCTHPWGLASGLWQLLWWQRGACPCFMTEWGTISVKLGSRGCRHSVWKEGSSLPFSLQLAISGINDFGGCWCTLQWDVPSHLPVGWLRLHQPVKWVGPPMGHDC